MAISDTITSMYENVGNVYDVLELAGADLTNVDKNIENLKQSWEERLLYFLANGTDVVWNNWLPKVNGTGESITLNNTIQAKMDFVYKGNTSQESTTGKNFFKNFPDTKSVHSITMTNDGETISISGTNSSSTFYPSFVFYADGSVSVLSWYPIASNIDITKGFFTESRTQYLFSILKSGTMSGDGATYIIGKETAITSIGLYNSENTFTNAIASNSEKINFIAIGFKPSQQVDITLKMQIEKGNSRTDYEPYTNGASPNPDYPQDVHVVTGDNEIKVEGKNLALNDDPNNPDANYISSGTGSQPIQYDSAEQGFYNTTARSRIFNLKSGNTYTFSIDTKKRTSGSNFSIYFNYYNTITGSMSSLQKALSVSSTNFERLLWNFTLSSDYDALRITVYSGVYFKNIQLEKSSTATEYEEHKEQTYPINLGSMELCKIGDYQDYIAKSTGKNLFDGTGWRLINSGNGFPQPSAGATIISSDKNNISFTSTQQTYAGVESGFIKVKANETYTLSANFKTPTDRFFVTQYDENKVRVGTLNTVVNPPQNTTFTTTNNGYIAISFTNTTTSSTTYVINNIQIEKSSTATTYEPYGTGWYKYGAIGKTIITNDNKNIIVGYNSNEFGHPRVQIGKINIGYISSYEPHLYFFNTYSEVNSTSNVMSGTFSPNFTKWVLHIYNDNFTDIETARNLLIGTIIYNPLATPTVTPITDTTLLSQLEAIKLSYNEQTNISQENDNLPFELDVVALGDN